MVAGDVTGRPYRILGVVSANVRKATIFSRSPSQAHVYRELWERAERLGADAVINARYGDARITAMSWGARRSEGQAIKFLTDAEIAARGEPRRNRRRTNATVEDKLSAAALRSPCPATASRSSARRAKGAWQTALSSRRWFGMR